LIRTTLFAAALLLAIPFSQASQASQRGGPGEPGQPGEPGRPGVGEPGRPGEPGEGRPGEPGQAACKQADLSGRWSLYAIGQAADTFVQECIIHLSDNGKFRSGSRCAGTSLRSDGLQVSNSCRISGAFVQRSEEDRMRCSVTAALAADKQIISGLGECGENTFFLFNMVRR
jgi:hypothetical protein